MSTRNITPTTTTPSSSPLNRILCITIYISSIIMLTSIVGSCMGRTKYLVNGAAAFTTRYSRSESSTSSIINRAFTIGQQRQQQQQLYPKQQQQLYPKGYFDSMYPLQGRINTNNNLCVVRMSSTIDNNSIDEGSLYDAVNYDDEKDYDDNSDNNKDGDDDNDDNDNDNNNNEESDNKNNPIQDLYQKITKSISKTNKTLTKKQKSLQNELDKAKSLEQIMKRANLIISNLYQLPPGTEEATVQDWDEDGSCNEITLVFNTKEYDSPQEEADSLFVSARKMKRGSKIVEELLSKTDECLDILNDASMDLDAALGLEDGNDGKDIDDVDVGRLYLIVDRLERTSSKTGFVMMKDTQTNNNNNNNNTNKKKSRGKQQQQKQKYVPSYRKFLSPNGCIVLVGKNRRDNEAICFQVARGDDIWFHARGCPGAHVLLQVRRGSPRATDDCMQFCANLAAFYSDARTERKTPVTTALPKHIQKPRGAPPGAVKLREELNTVTGFPANVSEELKVAREESGVIWDEAGSRSLGGKAKNKKRTKEVAKQEMAKRRAEKKVKRKRKADEGSDNFW